MFQLRRNRPSGQGRWFGSNPQANGNADRSWGEINDWVERVYRERSFVQKCLQNPEIRITQTGLFNSGRAVPGDDLLIPWSARAKIWIASADRLFLRELNPLGSWVGKRILVNTIDSVTIGKSISTVDSGRINGCLDKNGPTVEMQNLLLAIPWPGKTFCARPGKNHQSHLRNTS